MGSEPRKSSPLLGIGPILLLDFGNVTAGVAIDAPLIAVS
jgi:hypothetical protein